MMRRFLLCCCLLAASLSSRATDTLSIQQCKARALEQHPAQARKALAASAAALQLRNLESNRLPRVALNAVGSWQSDVFRLPIDNPLFAVPVIPRDQYKATAEVSERIWDGGSDRYLRRQYALDQKISEAQADVEAHQVLEVVTELYGGILCLQETAAILEAARADLQRRREQMQALVRQGVALPTSADQAQIQLLQTEQQLSAVQADQAALRSVLALWLGRADSDFHLRLPDLSQAVQPTPPRPEYRLFDLQQQKTDLSRDMLILRRMPRLEAFAQGGLGRPNPFNFFETGLQPFAMLGLRAAWTPFQWGNTGRDRQLLELQGRQIDVQKAVFERGLSAARLRDQGVAAKYRSLLANDDAQIALQENIVQRAEAQVQAGVLTAAEYLTQVRLLTQARITRTTHLIQAWQAAELATH
jgi:outer membrane protein TolC